MRFAEFKNQVRRFPILSGPYLRLVVPVNQQFKNQLSRWVHRGLVVPLRRNSYLLNADDRTITPSRLFIACELYRPAYVSLEYALARYGIIPERVADVTCVTTRKTMVIENMFGTFRYQHLKSGCFTGFIAEKDEAGLTYYLAAPEKAVVDFIYLNRQRFADNARQVLRESFRFQNLRILDRSKLLAWAGLFGGQKLFHIVRQVK